MGTTYYQTMKVIESTVWTNGKAVLQLKAVRINQTYVGLAKEVKYGRLSE